MFKSYPRGGGGEVGDHLLTVQEKDLSKPIVSPRTIAGTVKHSLVALMEKHNHPVRSDSQEAVTTSRHKSEERRQSIGVMWSVGG